MKTVTTSSLALLALLGLAGCGGAGSGAAAAPPASPTAQAGAPGAGGPPRLPGVSGRLAAIQGTTLQVQDTSSQTAVVYTATTAITQTVVAKRSDLAVGQCVVVRSTRGGSADNPASPASTVAAAGVTISSPVDGRCTGGLGGFGGRNRPGGARPSDAPRFVPPSGAPRPGGFRGGFGGGAFGKVTAIRGTSFTVASVGLGRPGATTSATSSNIVVTTSATTRFDKQQKATAAALKTGLCVTARGPADSEGTVTATSLALQSAVNGACPGGFGPRNG